MTALEVADGIIMIDTVVPDDNSVDGSLVDRCDWLADFRNQRRDVDVESLRKRLHHLSAAERCLIRLQTVDLVAAVLLYIG